MLRQSSLAILCAIAVLTACRSHVPELPYWSGTAGQLENGNQFVTFLHTHEGATVGLDIRIPVADFQGSVDSGSSSFVVWEECDNLTEGQQPSALSGGCTGFAYTIPNSPAAIQRDGSVYRLRGTFRVEPAGGPLQGLMLVKLIPAGAAK